MFDNNTLMYYHSLVYKIYIYFQLKEYIYNHNFTNKNKPFWLTLVQFRIINV